MTPLILHLPQAVLSPSGLTGRFYSHLLICPDHELLGPLGDRNKIDTASQVLEALVSKVDDHFDGGRQGTLRPLFHAGQTHGWLYALPPFLPSLDSLAEGPSESVRLEKHLQHMTQTPWLALSAEPQSVALQHWEEEFTPGQLYLDRPSIAPLTIGEAGLTFLGSAQSLMEDARLQNSTDLPLGRAKVVRM